MIHAIAISIVPSDIRFDILLKLLGGELKDLELKISRDELRDAIVDFAIYNVLLLISLVAIGRGVRMLLKSTNLDSRYPLLNLYHKWWYTFHGNNAEIGGYDLILIDLMVNTQNESVIYSGYLMDFDIDRGELETIYLSNTVKRFFKSEETDGNVSLNQAQEIPGYIFSIQYKHVLNMNISYYSIDNDLEEILTSPDTQQTDAVDSN